MSKTDAQTELVPRLRFPEFRDAPPWSETALTGICDVNPNHPGLPDSFYYIDLESVEAGTLQSPQRIERTNAPSRAQRLLQHGDILYQTVRPYQRNNLLFNIADGDDYVASTGYAQLRARESIGFLYQLVHTDSFVKRVLTKCTGSNYPAINSSDLESVSVWIPPDPAEQRKIAACLGSLDDLIAAQGRKLDTLRDHKKGLMQQLFPREGETQPRLRFPEFRDAGEWEPAKLSTIFDLVSGVHLAPDDYGADGEIPYFTGPSDFCNDAATVSKWTATSSNVAKQGDTLITVKGSGVGELMFLELPIVAMGRQLMAARPKNGAKRFVLYLLETKRTRFEDLASGNLIPGLSRGDILDLESPLPTGETEQHRIADCLSSLDAMLAAQAEKLEALRTHKRGLMQHLFPSPEEN